MGQSQYCNVEKYEVTGIVIIPALNPDLRILALIRELSEYPQLLMIVVNDGSAASYNSVFCKAAKADRVLVLSHQMNQGKGRAIKTALAYIEEHVFGQMAVVTADADGQHEAADILAVLQMASRRHGSLVLGVRQFQSREVPVRSRFGNLLTCGVFKLLTGIDVGDTQTGLRAFDASLIPVMLGVCGERYEYEMNVLLELAKKEIPFVEVPIKTVYLEDNQSSHFRVVRDSMKIYGSIFKFFSSSLACFCLDYVLYSCFSLGLAAAGVAGGLVISNVGARVISACCNFYLNRRYVFGHQGNVWRAAVQYGLLALVVLGINTGVLTLLVEVGGVNPFAAKLVTEMAMWGVSYLGQRWWVFHSGIVYRCRIY